MTYDGLGGYESFSLGAAITPFDGVYVGSLNDPHVIRGVTPSVALFFEKEIMPKELFLQNRVIGNDTVDFEGNRHIVAGRKVTQRVQAGDFDLAAGSKTLMHGGKSISLKRGFVAQKGAVLRAYVEDVPQLACVEPLRLAAPSPAAGASSPSQSLIDRGNNGGLASLKLFPNPVADVLYITYSKPYDAVLLGSPSRATLTILDMMGQEVMPPIVLDTNPYEQMLPISLPNGLYVCLLKENERQISSQQLVVIR